MGVRRAAWRADGYGRHHRGDRLARCCRRDGGPASSDGEGPDSARPLSASV